MPARYADHVWDAHKATITRLYMEENIKLGALIDIMASSHGFVQRWENLDLK